MTKNDAARIDSIIDTANALLNAGPNPSITITNMDVMEALLWDLQQTRLGKNPRELKALLEKDLKFRRSPCCEYCTQRCDGTGCKCHIA